MHDIYFQDLLNASDALGSVEINQFLKLWQKFKQAANKNDDPEDEIKKSFQQFDINGDGYITKDEITEADFFSFKMIYRSRVLKSSSKLRVAIGSRNSSFI